VNGVKEYRYFAGGEWRTAENRKLFDVFRPYDRGLYARVAAGGRPEAKLAVDAAANPYLRRDLAVACRHEVETSAELDNEESRAVMAGNALKLFPRLAGRD
jgi:acyl-CoA reductase-like NAD-dependent aldehyde dehydrogenase